MSDNAGRLRWYETGAIVVLISLAIVAVVFAIARTDCPSRPVVMGPIISSR